MCMRMDEGRWKLTKMVENFMKMDEKRLKVGESGGKW